MLKPGQVDHLRELLQRDGAYPKMETKALLREAYETTYGIYDHTQPGAKPLASVAYREAEDPELYSPYREFARRFRRLRVGDVFHISWVEFLALPKSRALGLIEEAGLAAEELRQQLNNIQNQPPKPNPEVPKS